MIMYNVHASTVTSQNCGAVGSCVLFQLQVLKIFQQIQGVLPLGSGATCSYSGVENDEVTWGL